MKHLLLTSDDQQILINGGECLCAFLSCVSTDLFAWTDPKTNISSIEYILQVLAKFLDPKTPENCCTFVGKLIRGFIREINKANQPSLLGETLGQILKAVLAKLQSTFFDEFIKSRSFFIFVFKVRLFSVFNKV